jgi:acyl carrier protein
MTDSADELEQLRDAPKFWRIFGRIVGETLEPANYSTAALRQWDSLRHVELIFELEEQYEVDIEPDDIVALYSDTDSILRFLKARQAA